MSLIHDCDPHVAHPQISRMLDKLGLSGLPDPQIMSATDAGDAIERIASALNATIPDEDPIGKLEQLCFLATMSTITTPVQTDVRRDIMFKTLDQIQQPSSTTVRDFSRTRDFLNNLIKE